jgi:putative holliday junction resolvase
MAYPGVIIGLDIGTVRTGVAISRPPVHIPSPLITVNSHNLADEIASIVRSESVTKIVAGLPRNMSGNETPQTQIVKEQIRLIGQQVDVPIETVDEAATSVKAEAELEARRKPYQKADIDMLAAVYILDDYMSEHPGVMHV